jgi:hypothetical protein
METKDLEEMVEKYQSVLATGKLLCGKVALGPEGITVEKGLMAKVVSCHKRFRATLLL